MVMLTSRHFEADDFLAAQELFLERGWTDGLPVIPPTPELVESMLTHTSRASDEVVGEIPERRRAVTAEKIAINAVMAGCAPEYMPVVVAAVEAMCDPASGPHGPTASTRGAGLLLIVNGPPVLALGINSGGNVFGPGVRANATIGRALRLIIMNCAGAYQALRIGRRSAIRASTPGASARTSRMSGGIPFTWSAASKPRMAL